MRENAIHPTLFKFCSNIGIASALNDNASQCTQFIRDKFCCIILYQDSPNKGHWVVIVRDKDEYLYFDSYGNKIDDPLNWVDVGLRKELNQLTPYLSKLLKNKPHKYNNKKYQKENPQVATCGRHCIFFTLNNRMNDLDLETYKKLMEKLKKKMNLDYDEIVSDFINIT